MQLRCLPSAVSAPLAAKSGCAPFVATRPAAGSIAFDPLRKHRQPTRAAAAGNNGAEPSQTTLQEFATLQLGDIQQNIYSRQGQINGLAEEVRRLRIQMRLRGLSEEQIQLLEQDANFPAVTEPQVQRDPRPALAALAAIILFGGIVAPIIEAKMGLGGAAYYDFIVSNGLPAKLAVVDPIVASLSGGSVGVLTSVLMMEANKTKQLTPLYALAVAAVSFVSGAVALNFESKMGLGGSSAYYNLIASMGLPTLLAEIDPVVAAVCGGGIGALSTLLITEAFKAQKQKMTRQCSCCGGPGFLTCGNCMGTGVTGAQVMWSDGMAPMPKRTGLAPSTGLRLPTSQELFPQATAAAAAQAAASMPPPPMPTAPAANMLVQSVAPSAAEPDSPRNLFLADMDRSPSQSPSMSRSSSPSPGMDRQDRSRSPSYVPSGMEQRSSSPPPSNDWDRSPSPTMDRDRSPSPAMDRDRSPSPAMDRDRSPSPAMERERSPSPVPAGRGGWEEELVERRDWEEERRNTAQPAASRRRAVPPPNYRRSRAVQRRVPARAGRNVDME